MTVAQASLVDSARRGFIDRFGSDPNGVWFAPGRINVIGEHTDYNDGFVLPFALDRGVAAAVALDSDGWVELISTQTGSVRFPAEKLGQVGLRSGHAESAMWAATASGMHIPGLKVFVDSTVPVGSGLSSSSAFICVLLVALNDLTLSGMEPAELALTAQRAETEGVGVPIGVMDPMVLMLSSQGHALLLDCRSLDYEHVPLSAAISGTDTEILIVDTRTERTLAAGEYADRRRACREAAAALGVASLRDVSTNTLAERSDRLTEVLLRRATHVVSENARVLEAVERIREGDAIGLGKLLDDSHRSLAEDFEVSAPALDLAVELCRDAGAYGARLTGAGFGGCVIGLFPAGSMRALETLMEKAFAARDMQSPRVFAAVPGRAAGRALP